MVAELCYETKPVVANFYENSFKQCSSVQQKQIGLLIGAAVGDAAACPLNGWSAEEISVLEKELNELENECDKAPSTKSVQEANMEQKSMKRVEIAFLQNVQQYISESSSSSLESLAAIKAKRIGKAQNHSYTFQLYNELVRTMSRARGEFPLNFVQPQWVSIAQEVDQHSSSFVNEHASLLHTLNVLLPIPTLYPYADDQTLRSYVAPFAEYLTETAWNLQETHGSNVDKMTDMNKLCHNRKEADDESKVSDANQMLYELAQAEKAAVIAYTLSMLSVALRYLQSNPNAIVNSAHMAIPGTEHAFPRHASKFCSTLQSSQHTMPTTISSSSELSSETASCTIYGYTAKRQQMSRNRTRAVCTFGTNEVRAIPETFLPRRPVMCDVRVLRESLSIAHVAQNFASGVRTAIRLGGNTAHRAMFVGALLGARFGVRNIPLEWLSATDGHQALATMAIDIAQWTWNPPHHSQYEHEPRSF